MFPFRIAQNGIRSSIPLLTRSLKPYPAALSPSLARPGYAHWSRQSEKPVASALSRVRSSARRNGPVLGHSPSKDIPEPESEIIAKNELLLGHNPDAGGLEQMLSHDTLVVTRQIEMLNIFMGFEVANRYAINDLSGNVLGYIAEEDRGFFGTIARQAFRTHRAFRSVIMDSTGTPVLWIHRPFSWINSRLFVQRKTADPQTSEESLVNFGEAQQEWHPWRRRYNLYLDQSDGNFIQFAKVDAGFLAWSFFLQNEEDVNIGSVRRGFRGVGMELFTDTGQYTINFRQDPDALAQSHEGKPVSVYKPMNLEQRALVMALSVGIDFDFFSRHSEGGGWGIPFIWAATD